jgi:gluconolactonase
MHRALAVSALAILLVASLSDCRGSAPGPTGRGGRVDVVLNVVERLDPALDDLVPGDATLERLAEGFDWSEGPVWRRSGGYLLFSDVPTNTIHRWREGEGLSVFMRPAGYTAANPPGRELGSNGLTFDASDRLVMADHGNRQIARVDERTFTKTTLADRYEGKRLNSPNDLVYSSRGDLYFTDPPYGLRGGHDDPAKELAFSGVYRLSPSGELTLLERGLRFPNGIALSPDERTLYVANSDPGRAVWMAYDLAADGAVSNGRVLFDATPLVRAGRKGLPDGLAVAASGHLFATGPGGVLVLSPQGTHLGTITTGNAAANCKFGDDGSTLYITAHMHLARIRVRARGAGF